MINKGTMTKISSVTVGAGGQASIDFTSIPSTYDDLVILTQLKSSRLTANGYDYPSLKFNDSSSGFSMRQYYASAGSVASYTDSSISWACWNSHASTTANVFSNDRVYIYDYKTSNNKPFSIDATHPSNSSTLKGIVYMVEGLWSNSSAITKISITPSAGETWVQNSNAILYGITRTPTSVKASGGIIYEDSNYWYHVFNSSGSFVPNQNITTDLLVVAGGGSGGSSYYAGGGGAGGLRGFTSQSLTANTSYAVTIGAGAASAIPTSKGSNGSDSQFGAIGTSAGGGGGGTIQTSGNGSTANGLSGGSGGGGGADGNGGGAGSGGSGNTPSTTPSQGNAGGNGISPGGYNSAGGGGGGAGTSGATATSNNGGNGGNGSSSYSSWGLATNTGDNVNGTVWYAGGGGGGGGNNYYGLGGNGGSGGGGFGAAPVGKATVSSGKSNTGGGGGGATDNGNSGAGGSGIVIVRYAK